MACLGQSNEEIYGKSDQIANVCRELGNQFYNSGKMFKALVFYNKSIAYSSSKEVLSLGYANRSAVYLSIECKEECLKNIELARENGYPTLSRLDEREEKCKKLPQFEWKNVVENPWNFFKLSYSANEKIPWIVDCVEVRTTQKYGRGIYATHDLKAGDIISVEEPLLLLEDSGFCKHCMNCHKTCLLNLIPCAQTSSMMFCSTDCMDDFYSKCIEMKSALNLDMQMLTQLAAPFGGHEKLDKFINEANLKELKKTIFDYDFSDPQDPNYKRNLMTCYLSLSSKENSYVDKSTLDISKYVSPKTVNHLFGITCTNSGKCMQKIQFDKDAYTIGSFRSLINHSCVPNVAYIHIDNKLATVVINPVQKGEQLFNVYYDSFGLNYSLDIKSTSKYFEFVCDCQLCIDSSYDMRPLKIEYPFNFMNRKQLQAGKERLNLGWHIINTNAMPENRGRNFIDSIMILKCIASLATFPC